jgi:hypothetical protein
MCSSWAYHTVKKKEKARQAIENDHNHLHLLPIQPCTVEPAVTTNMPENDLGMSWMFLPIVHGCSFSILFLLESTKNSSFIKPCHGKGDTYLHSSNMIQRASIRLSQKRIDYCFNVASDIMRFKNVITENHFGLTEDEVEFRMCFCSK